MVWPLHEPPSGCNRLPAGTLLDACYLKQGFDRLPASDRKPLLTEAKRRLLRLQRLWPDLAPPYILNYRPEEEWEELMPDDDETPCILLGPEGRCLLYDYRPMTCRLHGLPLVDSSGELFYEEWCTHNFAGIDPLALADLRYDFRRHFETELAFFRNFTNELLGERVSELDTFIPLALLQDFSGFDWRRWWEGRAGNGKSDKALTTEDTEVHKGKR